MMDRGTDATNVLSGKVIQVKLGIIGVVNRSQYDIDNNITIEKALVAEEEFLREKYPDLVGRIGSHYLARRLNEILMHHIQKNLPKLIKRISDLTDQYEAERDQLGPKVVEGASEKMWLMGDIVTDFTHEYIAVIKNRSSNPSDQEFLFPVQLTDSYANFNKELKNLDKLIENLDKKISLEIKHSANFEGLSSIENVFKKLVNEQIMRMIKPCTHLAEVIHEILSIAVEHCLKDKRVQLLNSEICRVTRMLLRSQLKDVKESIQVYMEIQTGMVWSSDEEYNKLLKGSNTCDVENESEVEDEDCDQGLMRVFHKNCVGSSSSSRGSGASFRIGTAINLNDNDQCQHIKLLITSYFNGVRSEVSNYMPKHLIHHLFDCTTKKIKDTVRAVVAGKENVLISEPELVLQKRKEIDEMLENLYQAQEVVGGIQSKY